MKSLGLIALILIFSGCAVIPVIPTASGKPEITIPNTTKEKVANEIINCTSDKGFILISNTPNLIILDQPITNALVRYCYGSRQNPIPNNRLKVQLTETDGGVRVLFNLFIVTNPGTAFEKSEDRNNSKDAYELYQNLENLKNKFTENQKPSPTSSTGPPLPIVMQNLYKKYLIK